jgi:hypothetical protein
MQVTLPWVLFLNNLTFSIVGTLLPTFPSHSSPQNKTTTSTTKNSLPLSAPLNPSATTLKDTLNPLKSGQITITLFTSIQSNVFLTAKHTGAYFCLNSTSPLSINLAPITKQMHCLGIQILKRGYILMNSKNVYF